MDYKATKDHDEIRSWVEEKGGRPVVRERRGADGIVIDIAFGDTKDEYEPIGWDEFFDTFDSFGMEFRYEVGEQDGKDFSYSLVDQQEAVDDVPNSNEMPEDDIPIENVIPSAPSRPSPDALNQNMNYTE
jgi:hypothetical protein